MKTIITTAACTVAVVVAILAAIVAYEVQHLPKVYQCTKVEE